MSSIENVSIFVPHVFPNFDEEYIVENFKQYGEIDKVDFVAKQDRNGKEFNSVYVHFKFWFDTPENRKFQAHLLDDSVETHIYHDDTRWYWIALPNNSKKHVSGDRKPRIDLGNDVKSINSSSTFVTPEKPVLKRSEKILGPPPKKNYSVADPLAGFSEWYDLQDKFEEDIESEMKICECEDPLAGFAGWCDFQPEYNYLPSAKCISDYYTIDSDEDAMRMEEIENEWAAEEMKEMVTEDTMKIEEFEEMVTEEDAIMMEELEDEWVSEDACLVSIDRRYIQEMEKDNIWLRNEVIQLRAAIVNLDYMYQVEVAKVRGLTQVSASDLSIECKKNV
jgi:hypothetical protein